jgi:hypothetical protein
MSDNNIVISNSGSCLENGEYGCGDPLGWSRDTLYPQMLPLTSTSGGRSVGIVRLRTKATQFKFLSLISNSMKFWEELWFLG